MYYSEEIGLPKTDISRWRLRSDALGRETWHYLSQSECESESEPQSTFVQWLLESPDFSISAIVRYSYSRRGSKKGS